MSDFITFEEAERRTGIDQYKLGRVKSGYLKPFIENKKFNIKKYNEEVEKVHNIRHLGQCIFYAFNDIYKEEEELAEYLSKVIGRKPKDWLKFFELDQFSIDKNNLILSWYEKKMVEEVYIDLKKYIDKGVIDWGDYYY